MKIIFNLLCSLALIILLSCTQQAVNRDVIELQATPFNPADTHLLEGSVFKHAMDKNADWLLSLEPDRLLHRFRLNANLEPKAEIYAGWETLGVSGHSLGHYLSACAMMYATTGNEKFKARVDYIVDELAECQKARKTGYVGAIPDEDRIWKEVSEGNIRYDGFGLNGGWVPWYALHKVWAGLIDSYKLTGSKQALEVVTKMSDWAVNMLSGLSEEQFQQMLACEFGGMNESFAEMYAITGDAKYLVLAKKFYHKRILDPLKEGKDQLAGEHSNTQVPKIIGTARIYELTNDVDYKKISTFYWDRIVNHHTYLNGGNSNHEHLGDPDVLNDRLSINTSETCNTYNMLKLTQHLFSWSGDAAYFDFYERALYNHILASQNPDDGMVCYFVPLESGSEKVFSTPFDAFWCCVGTGFENHTKYAENVFFKSNDGGLFVNLFIPTALEWKEKGMNIRMETKFPEEESISLKFEGSKQKFPIHIRYPKWTENISIEVNGIAKEVKGKPGEYFVLNEEWGTGVEMTIRMPMSVYTESMPDNANRIGVFYGPILLSASLGKEKPEVYDLPVFVGAKEDVAANIAKKGDGLLEFTTQDMSTRPISFMPLYAIHGQKHAVYFDVFSPSEWNEKSNEYNALIAKRDAFEARVIDRLRIGEMQPERDHELEAFNSTTGNLSGLKYRDAYNGWISFNVKSHSHVPLQMQCTYWGNDKDNRNFDIYVDGKHLKRVSLKGEHKDKLFDETYNIPLSWTQNKDKINVKFESSNDNHVGGLFGFIILKK